MTTESRRPAELEGTPGCLLDIPTERLDETAEHKASARKDAILTLVANWYGAYLTGRPTAVDHSTSPADCLALMKRLKVRAELLIDLIETDGGTPTTPPTVPSAVSVTGGPHSAESLKVVSSPAFDALHPDDRAYLAWLATFGSEGVPLSAHCPAIGPERSSVSRRMLHKMGLVEVCPWEDGYGFRASEVGKEMVAAKRTESREMAA